ncbi:MAG: hypothetical protein ACK4RS_05155, partial [Thiothrix sp.]
MSNKPHLYFYLPQLLQPLPLWRRDFAFIPIAPHLLRLLARAQQQILPRQGLENTVLVQCGYVLPEELPLAYYRYWLDFGVVPTQPLACADPVCLQSGIDQVRLLPDLPCPTVEQVNGLLQTLNQHLAEDGLQLVARHPQRWYLLGERLCESPLRTVPLSQALGQGIFPLLPQGEKRYWHRLLNEIQMLLHSSAVANVNALWLWGVSDPAQTPPPAAPQQHGIGTHVLAELLPLLTHGTQQSASTLMACELQPGQHYHIILDALTNVALKDDMQDWQQTLDW